MLLLWNIRDTILLIRPSEYEWALWVLSIIVTVVLTRWIVRRKQSSWALREEKARRRRDCRIFKAETKRLEGDRNKYMTMAFSNVVELAREKED